MAMICYKDMSFCSAKCGNSDCSRNLTKDIRDAARKWWFHDPDSAPIAVMDYKAGCGLYKEVME